MARKDPFSFWDLWVEPRLAFQRVDQGPARFESLLLLPARKTHPMLHHKYNFLCIPYFPKNYTHPDVNTFFFGVLWNFVVWSCHLLNR